jgi:hypothetical protein
MDLNDEFYSETSQAHNGEDACEALLSRQPGRKMMGRNWEKPGSLPGFY